MSAAETISAPVQSRATSAAPAIETARISIEGMHCASCVARLESELARTAGVVEAAVSLTSELATVSFRPQQTDLAALELAVQRAGYKPRVPAGAGEDPIERQERDRDREYRTLMSKFWFAAAISLPVLVLSYPDLFGLDRWSFFAKGSDSL